MDLKIYLNECKKHWRWFATSVITTLLVAIIFLLTTAPQYERSATVLVKDENGGNGLLSSMSASMGMLAGMAGINIASNVDNEMAIMSAPSMMLEVVNRLGLDTRYERYDFIMKRELWDETLPVKLTFPKLTDKDGAYLTSST